MTMYPHEIGTIPEETRRIAQAACPKGTLAMRLRDALGALYEDEQFVALDPEEGQPAYAPWRLAVVTVLQYTENLTDRQAANAVRERIDWKYALGLALSDAGFDYSLLSAFRTRLVEKEAETLLLDRLLEVCKQRGWLKEGGKQRTDSTHVLARVRSLAQLECVGETLRAALDDLAELAPDWLVQQVTPDWLERYSHCVENYRLRHPPKANALPSLNKSGLMGFTCWQPGIALMRRLRGKTSTVCRCSVRSGSSMTTFPGGKPGGEQARAKNMERESFVPRTTPKRKRAKSGKRHGWVTSVHLTETCGLPEEPMCPHLLVQVQTTVAPLPDAAMTAIIQEELVKAALKPEEQIAETGDVDADLLSSRRQRGIKLVGPTMPDRSWQAKAGKGFDVAHFSIAWTAQQATCPQGQMSARFSQAGTRMEIVFAPEVCAACPVRQDWTHSQTTGRVRHVRPQAGNFALQAQRHAEQTQEFRQQYALRSGIEGTFSQAVRAMGIRRSRYDGLARTHVQHVLTAVAINLVRIDAVLTHHPRGKTRRSQFAQLASTPAIPDQIGA